MAIISAQILPTMCKLCGSSLVKSQFLYQKRNLSVSIRVFSSKVNIFYKSLRGILERDSNSGNVQDAGKQLLKAKNLLTESCQRKSEILHNLLSTRSDIQRKRSVSTVPDTEYAQEQENQLLVLENALYKSLHNANASGLSSMEDLVFAINNYHEQEKKHINIVKTCYLFISLTIIIIIVELWPKLEPKKEKFIFPWALPKKT